jgi:FixJ family two-component response regulator
MMIAGVSHCGTSRVLMSPIRPIVFVVDDDASVRESLEGLVRFAGWDVETFAAAQDFLDRPPVQAPSCLVLDMGLPDLNGLELQERIALNRIDMPIIFITGHGDIPMTVKAMKAGAVEFLIKPLGHESLLSAIRTALARSEKLLDQEAQVTALRDRYRTLSVRERDVTSSMTSLSQRPREGSHGAGDVRKAEQTGRW